jgi:hypothetical protein
LPPPEKSVLHYLNGQVEVEVFLPMGFSRMAMLYARLKSYGRALEVTHPAIRLVSLNCCVAPN